MSSVTAHASGGLITLLLLGIPTFAGIILLAYLASRRQPRITRLSKIELRRRYVRGEITPSDYHAEISRRGG